MQTILIIKFGAVGDVLRTTPLLYALKKRYPFSRIYWLTDKDSKEVLEESPLIDQLYLYSKPVAESMAELHFDLALCLDKEKEALETIMKIKASKKRGFGMDASGHCIPLDEKSEYAVQLGIDDELKFKKNKKTYQEISFEQVGLAFHGEEYCFDISQSDRKYGLEFLSKLDLKRQPVVGLNTGSGVRFSGKKLPIASYIEIAEILTRGGYQVLLLGGFQEKERNVVIEKSASVKIYNVGSHHTVRQFASIVSFCDLIITGDTLAMHVAIAMKRPVLVFFASTCASEIELYGRGEKLISDIDCSPCYLRECPIDEKCMKDFSARFIANRAMTLLRSPAK